MAVLSVLVSPCIGCEQFNLDLDLKLKHINSSLFAGNDITPESVRSLFKEVSKEGEHHKARESDESNESISTNSSASSAEVVNGLEIILDDFYTEPYRSTSQLKVRRDLITILHLLEKEIDPFVFERGVVMIAEGLSA